MFATLDNAVRIAEGGSKGGGLGGAGAPPGIKAVRLLDFWIFRFDDFRLSDFQIFRLSDFYGTLLDPTGPYWNLLDPTGRYWTLLDLTGPY